MEMRSAHTTDILSVYLLSTCLAIDPPENEKKTDAPIQASAYINNQSVNSRHIETLTFDFGTFNLPDSFPIHSVPAYPLVISFEERLRKFGLLRLEKRRL